ncbi:MAG: hypothetical protein JO102_00065 [Elusimicrobia bacterium]|nr:hypothetical protein [Elusimicrobiota bacterium]
MSNPFENPERLREREAQKTAFLTDLVRQVVMGRDAIEKARFLLWLYDAPHSPTPRPKPYFLIRLETEFHVNFDSMRAVLLPAASRHVPEAGRSAYKEFLSAILSGRNNIFDDRDSQKLFLDGLFDSMIPASSANRDFLRVVFDAVFRYADDFRREDIVVNLTQAMSSLNGATEALSAEQREARSIRLMLEALGLVGVKISQILARSPSTPAVQRAEFEKSESAARPLPKGIIFDLIAKLGLAGRVISVEEPLGSASIKVVYKVVMDLPKLGRVTVAFKVKRPDVEKRIQNDLEFTEAVLGAIGPELQSRGVVVPKRLVEQIKEIFTSELNFNGERYNADRLRDNLEGKSWLGRIIDWILSTPLRRVFPSLAWCFYRFRVPRIYTVMDNTIIIEELVQGTPLSNAAALEAKGYNVQDLRRRAAREFFRQLFIDGFYHADPKVGHVIVDGGNIYLIDAGASSEIKPENRTWLRNLVKALGSRKEADLFKLVPGAAAGNAQLQQRLRDRVINSADTEVTRAMWFFQTMEDFDVTLPAELWAVFRFLAAGGSLFEAPKPKAKAAAATLLLPSTFYGVLAWLARYPILGRPAEWKIALAGAVRETAATFSLGFVDRHPNESRAQTVARWIGFGVIHLGAVGAALAFHFLAGVHPGTLGYFVGLAATFLAGNIAAHFIWDAAPLAVGRSMLTPNQRTLLSLVRTRDTLPAADRAQVNRLLEVMPKIVSLDVGDGLDLRNEAVDFLRARIDRGETLSGELPALVHTMKTDPASLKAYDDVRAGDAAGLTMNLRVLPDGLSLDGLRAEARRDAAAPRGDNALVSVFAVTGEISDADLGTLNAEFSGRSVFVRNDDSLVFEKAALAQLAGGRELAHLNVFIDHRAGLSEAALASLEALQRLDPRLASIYLLIESATRIAVPVSTSQLSDMVRFKRVIDVQA